MSRFTNRFLVAAATFSLAGFVGMAPATADSQAGICNSGTVVTATLKVDGVSTAVNASGSTYALNVCRVADMNYYTVQVGLYDGGVLKEDLLAANLEKIFEVTFVPTAGDTLTVADFYGRVQSYAFGANVVVAIKPTTLSIVDDPTRACAGKEFTDATCIARAATRDLTAMVLGTVRFDTSARPSNYSKLAGATVSAAANLYDISLSGPCPLASTTYSGNDGGFSRPPSDSTTLTVKMVGPHYKQNGATLNTGYLEVFIPKETITACFGGTATDLATSLGMTRAEAGVTAEVVKTTGAPATGLQYATAVIGDGLRISVSAVTFSDPTYNLLLHKANVAPTSTTVVTVVGVQPTTTQLSRKSARSAKSLATQAKLSVLAGSKISLKVLASTSRNCKVTGTTIKSLKVGSCKVIVTVKPRKGPSRSKTLTLKVV
jgi:hypothetical protein